MIHKIISFFILIILFFYLLSGKCFAQDRMQIQDTLVNKKRLKTLLIGGSSAYATAMVGLSTVWYSQNEMGKFHFFNDNAQWKQMDKAGHFYSAFLISHFSYQGFRWANLHQKKSAFWGAMTGVILMTPIEVLDGFSKEYGASWGDALANSLGSFSFYAQLLAWSEIRIHPKFSFSPTSLARQRPEVLGMGLTQELIKDYNGQTYWLSFDLDKFFPSRPFPRWLNLAAGYGAQDMLYARNNENQEKGWDPYRQYYLAIDPDLTAIRTKNKFVKTVLFLVNLVRLPAPALEYSSRKGWKFHYLFF